MSSIMTKPAIPGVMAADAPSPVTLAQALPIWVRISALSFGGPAGQIAVMHRVRVEEKRWISENCFLHVVSPHRISYDRNIRSRDPLNFGA